MVFRWQIYWTILFLAVMAAACAVGAYWCIAASRQADAIRALDADVCFDNEYVYVPARGTHSAYWDFTRTADRNPFDWKTSLFHSVKYVSYFKKPLSYAVLETFPSLFHLQLDDTATDADLAYLSPLYRLAVLDLSRCSSISDAGLLSLAQLRSLRSLDLGKGIADRGLANLSALHQLETLGLDKCETINGSGLASLNADSLAELSLGKGINDEGFKNVARFKSLRGLYVFFAPITDHGMETLSSLPKLERLQLLTVPITDRSIGVIAGLPDLKLLSFIEPKDANVSHITTLSPLSACQKLEILDIRGSQAINDKSLTGLEHLRNLKVLQLDYTSVTGGALDKLGGLPNLRFLSLVGCPVDDSVIDRLAAIQSLRWVALSETRVTQNGLDRLRILRPELKIGAPENDDWKELQK